ncbi:MAG: helix-turn-helix domain-containing protein [Planctomycetes bacterium]|nr:helix-turn-helix domain-containing protein [Planctomycetota bacterium]
MRGRTPVGPELTEKLAGSALARERMQVILETIAGECRVQEACKQLGICQQRFERLRVLAIEAGIAALELKPAGRPAKILSETEIENIRLKQQNAELEAELIPLHAQVSFPIAYVGRSCVDAGRDTDVTGCGT